MKRIIIISSLVLLGVIILGCVSVIGGIRPIDKCSGYKSVRFGMDVTRATAMVRRDGMLIKNPNNALTDIFRIHSRKYRICATDEMGNEENEIIYHYNPYTKQIYDIMIFYPKVSFENYDVFHERYNILLKELENKYGKFHFPLPTSEGRRMEVWWGFKKVIYLLKGFDLDNHRVSVFYRDKKLIYLYDKQKQEKKQEKFKKAQREIKDKI